VGAGGTNANVALQKYFSDWESYYGRNVPDDRRQRASAAASSVLASGRVGFPSESDVRFWH
jgi:hypothetical protein